MLTHTILIHRKREPCDEGTQCFTSAWGTFTSMTLFVVVVQLLSRDRLSVTLWTAAPQPSLSFSAPEVCSNSCPLSQ